MYYLADTVCTPVVASAMLFFYQIRKMNKPGSEGAIYSGG
jgi:hypothetical protein